MTEKRILLVEDNADDEELILRSLRKAAVANAIDVVRDGEEAIRFLFAEAPFEKRILPVVVMLDLKLPKVDGHQVLRRVRADPRTQLLPIVVLTSSDADRDILQAYQLGANSYVKKPVEFLEFAEAVRQLGLYWTVTSIGPPR